MFKFFNPVWLCTQVFTLYGGGDSSSSSANSTSTQNVDKRQVINSGAVGVTTDGGSVSITNQNVDAGIVTKALDTVAATDATNGAGFNQLLSLADKMFTGAGQIIGTAQQTTLSQMGALQTAANDQKGAIDQKTLVILAVAGVGALYLKGKK